MIHIQLKPEVEARLAADAKNHGMAVQAYAESLLEQALARSVAPRHRTRAEMAAFYRGMAADSEKIPQLPDEAFTRESFYKDHN